jgi:tRNA (uracil-5-)-methyltransferase
MFQISPGAFFQVNTEGAEILYRLVVDKIREIAPDPSRTLLFDVCCGTGTIGLTCLKAGVVGRVVGVDISEPAIMDAKRNASLNGYSTELSDDSIHADESPVTRFVASRAELVLGREIQRVKQLQRRNDGPPDILQFVAVVDPAREGLHADVIKAIRSNNQICHLVYVSCNPTATLVRDAALLCSPPTKRYTGRPFRIVAATPVDMFPLTNHCEMVMTFHRLSDDDMHIKEVGKGETHDK